ncbi:MAG TPA: zinc-ribbon domain-containing protein [Ktedonobacteraceae bacterium]
MLNSLAVTHPELLAQWHPTKNSMLTPHQVTAGSSRKVWWRCPKGPDHEWEAKIVHRAKGSNCPFCRGLKTSGTNSLATLFPDVAAQWHTTKNGRLTPEQVVAGSEQKVWWQCPKEIDHIWKASLANRTYLQRGCPMCAGKQVVKTNSLAHRYSELARQWHHTKNGSLTPDQVVVGSQQLVWWKCSKGPDHEWRTSVAKRAKDNRGCPCCSGRKVSVTNCLATMLGQPTA